MNNFGGFSFGENLFYCIRVVVGANPYGYVRFLIVFTDGQTNNVNPNFIYSKVFAKLFSKSDQILNTN